MWFSLHPMFWYLFSGLAIAADKKFKTFEAAYPYVVQKLLTDNSPATRRILHSVSLSKNCSFYCDFLLSCIVLYCICFWYLLPWLANKYTWLKREATLLIFLMLVCQLILLKCHALFWKFHEYSWIYLLVVLCCLFTFFFPPT